MHSRTTDLALMLARHGAATVLVSLLITALLTATGLSTWDVNLVYSLSIGLLSWLTIECGRFRFADHPGIPWPRGWRGVAVVLAGVVVGLGLGSWIGQSYQSRFQPGGHASHLDAWFLPLAITVVTSAAMSFVFYLIGTSRHLQMRVAQAEHQAAQARLTLLQTQLEPHMLFNTLANLRVLIAADPQRAQTMLDHLIDYLRATLGNSRSSVHSLCEEFARLQDYLSLMQIRMGTRLTFTLDLQPTLVNVPLPPLLLQPLVENSIRHGLEPQLQGGHLHVAARQIASDHGHAVELTVRDTGQGLPAGWEAMASETPGAPHFGTSQVRERLATWYGGAATFALSAAPQPPGTLARIVFPLEPRT